MVETQQLRGYLVIYVDGYKMRHDNTAWIFTLPDGSTKSVPDPLLPPPLCEPGSDEWRENAWAVGDNPRERLCLARGPKALRQFHNYDEAVNFIMARQRRFKKQRHFLVYVTRDVHGKDCYDRVSSTDEIEAVHAERDREAEVRKQQRAAGKREYDANFPHVEALEKCFSRNRSLLLAGVLRDIRDKGLEATKTAMPRASWYRALKDLRTAGLAFG